MPGTWGDLSFLNACPAVAFHEFVEPMANMTKLTYTATVGCSYFNPADQNASVPGWERELGPGMQQDPAEGGMRALLFTQPSTKKAVVAFRGTDLNETNVSGQADSCADKILWGGLNIR